MDPMRQLLNRIAKLERNLSNVVRIGTVKAVDQKKNTADISVGPGDPITARGLSLGSGNVKFRVSTSVGQVVTMLCPGGDARQACFLPGDWTGKNASPSAEADEVYLTIGEAKIRANGGEILLQVGGSFVRVSGDGIKTNGDVDLDGGSVRNDGTPIDKTHTHGGISRGASDTDPPNG